MGIPAPGGRTNRYNDLPGYVVRRPVMEALEAPEVWTGQPVREGAFTPALSLEREGYNAGGGYLLPREG